MELKTLIRRVKYAGVLLVVACDTGPSMRDGPSIVDVHVHALLQASESHDPRRADLLRTLDSLRVEAIVLSGAPDALADWAANLGQSSVQVLPSLLFPCPGGHPPLGDRQCFADNAEFPDLAWLRREITAGRIRALGEVTAQYLGMPPDDPRLDPYFTLAEEYDIPVSIHLGLAPPGAAYASKDSSRPSYRVAAGSPVLLEQVLVRHRRLRISVMHAGWPRLEEMISIMQQYEQVYVDLGVLHWALPHAVFQDVLTRLTDAELSDRIMYGTDGGPAQLKAGVQAILHAPMLTEQEKQLILHDNAIRFYRIDTTTKKRVP